MALTEYFSIPHFKNHTFVSPMLMKAHTILCIVSILFGSNTLAQQPSHYLIGEEELSGVDIYNISQDNDMVIWLTSNNGVIKYDGYAFKVINSLEAKSKSFFNLTKNSLGDLFCCNLNGQIFKIEGDLLHLFYEIPDSLLSGLVHFNFDNNDRLVFCTDNYYSVDDSNKPKFIFPHRYASIDIPKNGRNELIFYNQASKQIAYYKNDKLTLGDTLNIGAVWIQTTENVCFISNLPKNKPLVYHKTNTGWEELHFNEFNNSKDEGLFNFLPINDSLLALVGKSKGIYLFNSKGEQKYANQKLFSRYRISATFTDIEGNLWLTTLGKGIIIIPNTDVKDYLNHPTLIEDDIKALSVDDNDNLYVAGLNRLIYKLSDTGIEIFREHTSEIEFLKVTRKNKLFIYNNRLLDLNREKEYVLRQVSSIKDVFIVDSNYLIFATNNGIKTLDLRQSRTDTLEVTTLSNSRTNCVTYDTVNHEIWAGTISGLQRFNKNQIEYVLYSNSQVSASDFEHIDGEIWVATVNNGILIYKNGKFSRSFRYLDENNIRSVYKLKKIGSNLYLTTEKGLFIYDFQNKSIDRISTTDGLLSNRPNEFEVIGNTLYLLHSKGLQKINLKSITKNTVSPLIKWKNILVNRKRLSSLLKKEYSHDQNQFEFHFTARAYRHRGELIYQYRLIGSDKEWHDLSFSNNFVKFQSLPAGNYTFEVKAINENNIESEVLSYSFSISPPFWLTWWFFVLCGLMLLLILGSVFLIRSKIVRKRLILEKQLKISEITAIKAQMNPHFVFNALNSIQDLIMIKDVRSSNVYLGKFADLMRKTLEYSGKNFIHLSEEIDLLELYLELEKLRFGVDLHIQINYDRSQINLKQQEIPSMLIQPYVENAIKHGLLHKKGQKKLVINFYLKNDVLFCEIIDNGVGRQKSEEIKRRREKTHLSFSSEANKKRIDLIRESTQLNISLDIIDLMEYEKPAGTMVVLKFH